MLKYRVDRPDQGRYYRIVNSRQGDFHPIFIYKYPIFYGEILSIWTNNKMQRTSIDKNNIKIACDEVTGALNVTLVTERLYLQSIVIDDLNNYSQLLSDPVTMEKYFDGMPWTLPKIEARVATWVQRWKDNDPFSALTVR